MHERQAVRREFWVVLAVLGLFLSGLPALFAIPAGSIVFNPASYKQALASQEVYERFPLLVGDMVLSGGDALLFGSGDRLLEALERSNYEQVMRLIFPEAWVREQSESLIDQFWAYFNFQRENFTLRVDLRPVKARLGSPQVGEISTAVVQNLPGCTEEDLLNFGLGALSGTLEQLPLCRPPQLEGVANLVVQGLLSGAGAAMPEQIDLASALRIPLLLGGEPVSQAWSFWFGLYRAFRQASPWLPWVALLCLGLVGLAGRRTLRGPFYWLGLGLALPGAAAAVITLLLALWSSQFVPLLVARLFGENLVIFSVLVDTARAVMGRYLLVVGLSSLAALLVGAAFLGVWYWQRQENRTG